MKKVKYELYFSTRNLSGMPVPIPGKTFKALLRHYEEKISETRADYPCETDENGDFCEWYVGDMSVTTEEHEKYVKTVYQVYDDGSYVTLSEYRCRPGFHWE